MRMGFFYLKFLTAIFSLWFYSHPCASARLLGYFALCGGRPGLSALDLTTFEKAAKAFNTGPLCAPFSFMHAPEQ